MKTSLVKNHYLSCFSVGSTAGIALGAFLSLFLDTFWTLILIGIYLIIFIVGIQKVYKFLQ